MSIQEKLISHEDARNIKFQDSNINGIFWNVRSLKAREGVKFDEIKNMIENYKYLDFLCFL